MSDTQYPGIDYGRFAGTNRDRETGIHFGAISQNSVMPEALDDIMTHGEDLAWSKALAEAIEEAKTSAENPDDFSEDEIADGLSMNWESNIGNYLYQEDGYKITGCLDNDLFVMASKFYTFAQFCSPCVPGAGNLDNPFVPHPNQQSAAEIITMAIAAGFPKTYCLGHDWFEGGKAPYPVLSVETNEIV